MPMPDTLNEREEHQLLDAVKKASDLVASGLSPDAAVEKVARDHGFGPGKIRLIGQGYNTGQQLGQWRTPGASILDKLASFPLCNPDAVIDAIYNGPSPAEKAAACRVDDAYTRPPRFPGDVAASREKVASYKIPRSSPEPYKPDPAEAVVKAFGNIARAKNAADECRRQTSVAVDGVMTKVANLVGYFKQASHARVPFAVVEDVARTYYGASAGALMDMVYQRAGLSEKRAGVGSAVLANGFNLKAEPFVTIKAAIDQAGHAAGLKKEAADLSAKFSASKTEELRPFSNAGAAEQPADSGPWSKTAADVFQKTAFGFGTEVAAIALGDIAAHKATHSAAENDPYGDVSALDRELDMIRQQSQQAIGMRRKPREKAAFLGAGLGTAIGSSIGRTMGSVTKTKDDLVDDAWMGLEDPEHENELRKIRAHSLINQLMTDPDDPISGHDPDKVLAAYNEISAAAPRVAENAATLRPALRKRLEGHQEPFESKELLDIEHGLAKSKMPTPNTNILGSDAPGGLLG